jgi:hypothetical protein
MRTFFRSLLAGTILTAALVGIGAPTLAAGGGTTYVTVSCSNGFTRTVSAHAAKGIANSLNKFNAYTHSGVTCAAGAGALATAPTTQFLHIECSNGFTKRVSAHAAGGINRALNNFNGRSHTGVTCAVAP